MITDMIFYVKLTIFILMPAFIMAAGNRKSNYDLCMSGRNNTYAELTGSILKAGKRKVFDKFTVCGCFKSTAKPGVDGLLDDAMTSFYFSALPGVQAYVPCGKLILDSINGLPSDIDKEEGLCDGRWHHGCTTYSASTGLSKTYIDYCYEYGGFNITSSIAGQRSLNLSAVQNDEIFGSIGGVFDGTKNENFRGCGTDANMYSRAFTPEEVMKHCRTCNHNDGDIFKWSNAGGHLRGEVIPVRPSDARAHYRYSRKSCEDEE